jgi:hypothetical protein
LAVPRSDLEREVVVSVRVRIKRPPSSLASCEYGPEYKTGTVSFWHESEHEQFHNGGPIEFCISAVLSAKPLVNKQKGIA